MSLSRTTSTAALLDWYRDMGVDEAISAMPMDWYAASAERIARKAEARTPSPTPVPQESPASPRAGFSGVAPDEAVMDARERASKATTLEELQKTLESFNGCPLKATAKNTCFKRGSNTAKIMLIGEGPGRDEDIQGQPFVGRAGQLLDKMLGSIGLDETHVYITNIVYWRPPGNRTPTSQEVEACLPFLNRQAELLDPDILVLIGGPAAQNLLGVKDGITRLRGKWKECELGGKPRKTLPMLHPAYLLRTPAAKKQAWRDLLSLKGELKDKGLLP